MSLNATQVRVEVGLQYVGNFHAYHGSHGNATGVESTTLLPWEWENACDLCGENDKEWKYYVFHLLPQQANCAVFTQQFFQTIQPYSADERGNSSDSAFIFLLLISGCFVTILFHSLCNLPANRPLASCCRWLKQQQVRWDILIARDWQREGLGISKRNRKEWE